MNSQTLDNIVRAKLIPMLPDHEGEEEHLYDDATGRRLTKGDTIKGHPSIGVGHNLDASGLCQEAIDAQLEHDIGEAVQECRKLSYWEDLGLARRVCISNMVFNLGLPTYRTFRLMEQAIEERNYARAAEEMKNSLWARQVGERAEELAEIMRTGTLDPS